VWNLDEHVVVEVKARQVIGAFPATNRARAISQDLVTDLGVQPETVAAKQQ
jgi:hypothetical protein